MITLSDDARRYPPSICAYEMARGIVRHEINGHVYIMSDWPTTNAKLDAEVKQRENDIRLWEFSKTPESFTDWIRPRIEERRKRGE